MSSEIQEAEDTLHMGTFNCTAGLQFEWFAFHQTIKFVSSKTIDLKPAKQQTSCPVILSYTVSVRCREA